jgi:hypothetical protein
MAGQNDKLIPTWFLAPIDCLKISAQVTQAVPAIHAVAFHLNSGLLLCHVRENICTKALKIDTACE